MEGSSSNRTGESESMGVVMNQGTPIHGIRMENPFTLKVGQVFTGFGVGCGVGIGAGRPINLGAVPVVNQVISSTRGATDAFSGISRHVNHTLRKFGAKNIEAGIGCGVGFGHGFGIGLAIKPSVLHQVQACLMQTVAKMTTKFRINPTPDLGQNTFPVSLKSSMSLNGLSNQTPIGGIKQFGPTSAESISQNLIGCGDMSEESTFRTETEKVISSFLQNPVLKGENAELNDVGHGLRMENRTLQMVIRHQQLIEKLMEENEKVRRILMEDLKISPHKLESTPCSECFECRRKQRKR